MNELPWWLDGGDSCPFCLQPCVMEMGGRCPHCDRLLCAACLDAAREEGRDTCADCSHEDAGDEPAGVTPERET